ncbi:MAG TPA: hypothetical protein VGC42_09385, partial [Kofleriaceae bacterium]
MRFAPLVLFASASLIGGCSLNGNGSECTTDAQCGDDVCARSGECTAKSSVHSVMVTWTVNSAVAAGSSACTQHPDLFLQFDGTDYGDALRFAPVPCAEGVFSVDKLPTRYQSVVVGFEGNSHSQGDAAVLDASTTPARATLSLFDPTPSDRATELPAD